MGGGYREHHRRRYGGVVLVVVGQSSFYDRIFTVFNLFAKQFYMVLLLTPKPKLGVFTSYAGFRIMKKVRRIVSAVPKLASKLVEAPSLHLLPC